MIVDELVTLLQFDLPPQSKAALSGVDKAVGGITDKIKSLGIVSMVTSGIFAAFTVNAAREATSLANLSDAVGVNKKEIQALGAIYKQLGGSAKSFAADAAAYKQTTGRNLDLDRMVELSKTFSSMSKDAAFHLGHSYGFSDDMIRVLMKGPDELRKMGDEAIKYNTTSEQSLKNLQALDEQWAKTTSIISPIADEVQAAFAPVLMQGLKDLSEWLKTNKEDIIAGSMAIAKGVEKAWEEAKKAGSAIVEALKPMWEMLDKYVKEHGGWENAISLTAAALSAIAAATIPLAVIKSITGLFGALVPFSVSGLVIAGGITAIAASMLDYDIKLKDVVDGIVGNIDRVENRISDFNKKPSLENMASPDLNVRVTELQERGNRAQGNLLGEKFKYLGELFTFSPDAIAKSEERIHEIMEQVRQAQTAVDVATHGSVMELNNQTWIEAQAKEIMDEENQKRLSYRAFSWLLPNAMSSALWGDAMSKDEALARAREKGGFSAPGLGSGQISIWRKQGYGEEDIRGMAAGTQAGMKKREEALEEYGAHLLGNDGYIDYSFLDKGSSETDVEDAEIAKEAQTVRIRRPTITPQRDDPSLWPEIGNMPSDSTQRASNSLTNNTTNVTIYQMSPPTPNAQLYHDQGGTSFQRATVM